MERSELETAYKKLDFDTKKILATLWLVYDELEETTYFELLTMLRISPFFGKKQNIETKGLIKDLMLKELLIKDKYNYYKLNPLLPSLLIHDISAQELIIITKVISERLSFRSDFYWRVPGYNLHLRQFLWGLLLHDAAMQGKAIQGIQTHYAPNSNNLGVARIYIENGINLKTLLLYTEKNQADALKAALDKHLSDPEDYSNLDNLFEQMLKKMKEPESIFQTEINYAILLFIQAKFKKADAIISKYNYSPEIACLKAGVFVLQDSPVEALSTLESGLKVLRNDTGKRNVYFNDWYGLIPLFSVLKQKDAKLLNKIGKYVSYAITNRSLRASSFELFKLMLEAQTSDLDVVHRNTLYLLRSNENAFNTLLAGLMVVWHFPEQKNDYIDKLKKYYILCSNNGQHWLAYELNAVLNELIPNDKLFKQDIKIVEPDIETTPLVKTMTKEEEWERSLRILETLQSGLDSGSKEFRLAWFIDMKYRGLTAKEQKMGKNGWLQGRKVSLVKTLESPPDYITSQDLRILTSLHNTHSGSYAGVTLLELAGHPYLYLEQNGVRMELIKELPKLVVKEVDGKYEVSFSVDANQVGIILEKETPTRYKVYEIKELHQQIATSFKNKKLEVPKKQKDRLLAVLSNLSSEIPLHSDVEISGQEVRKVDADPRIFVHLMPLNDGFKAELYVKPFSAQPPYFKPGKGSVTIVSTIEDEKVQAVRNLEQEIAQAYAILAACPAFAQMNDYTDEAVFDGPSECLEALTQLHDLGDKVVLEWPEGEKLRITHKISFDNLSMRIKQQNNWFDVSGEVKLDEKLVWTLQELLEKVQQSKSNFIEIGEGQYLAITSQLRKRMEDLNAYAETSGKQTKLHPLAALAMDDLSSEIKNLEIDKAWTKQLAAVDKAMKHKPKVPVTLQAQLRDYQVDGFNWLSRLAAWGVGACLADDMGLGKTIQAIALVLERAGQGPTLVVAPTSVARNWVSEVTKFAPTLNTILFNEVADRQSTIENAKALDMVITSYGLLQGEAELFTSKNWTQIILDEAHAIKNATTKTSKAAMQLQADFRIITTGTPMQNHLGELWNLFQFINPGLLSSQQRFNERFAIPIARDNDKEKSRQLKKLIQPFILRRTKAQVLDELPEKTEITLNVEMSTEERAFYEALRRQAIDNLEKTEGSVTEKSMQILAEISRLRQACCHPEMVTPGIGISSAKLQILDGLLTELLDNNHRTLIFSQFVKHLTIIRKHLETRGISYQYLDGSTPPKEREKNIQAFQAGQSDVFLISLKAGGVGLNLTAADYVIHMDPWWNPAVEDQASDRAHRIGQLRPVTIYRLVTEDTIEEKIVNMHHQKRDLADSLLEGTDIAGKITGEELLNLIKQK